MISRFSSVSVASSATFLLNGFSQSIGSLAGAGSVTDNASTGTNISLTIGSDNASPTFSGVLSNTTAANTDIIALLTKSGSGNQTFSTATGAVWTATGAGGGYDLAGPSSGPLPSVIVNGGTLTLDLSHATTQTNLINPYYALQLSGGTIALNEAASSSGSSQTFNSTMALSGGSAVVVDSDGNTSATGFILGSISRGAGGTVDFTPGSATTGNINTTNAATSFVGGWATVAGTNWAGINGSGNIVPLTSAGGSYANDTWSGANNTTVTVNSSPASGSTTNSLRFNAAGPSSGGLSVTLSGANTITSGGILVTPNAGANGATIAGSGSLASGGGELIVNQFDSSGPLTIAAQITGGALTKSGPGALVLANSGNTYSGTTTVNGGALSISADGNLGTSTSVVLNNSTLQLAGSPGSSFTVASTRGLAIGPSSGTGGATLNVPTAGTTETIAGAIANDGTSISALTKTGPGTLILSGTNTYTGGTYIDQGILFITSGVNLGSPNGPGLNAKPVVFTGNGVLQVGGTSIARFRGGQGEFVLDTPNAVIDNNHVGTIGSISIDQNIVGTGGLTYISSIGNTNGGVGLGIGFGGAGGQTVPAYNSTYAGPTTIYASNVGLSWSTINGAPYQTNLNPNNVLNLGGTISVAYGNAGPGANTTSIESLATYINLTADTSSHLGGGASAGFQVYLNSSNSAGIVRAAGSTLEVDVPNTYYVANNAVTNTNGIIGGWATAGTSSTITSNGFPQTVLFVGTDWATIGAGAVNPLSSGSYTSDAWASGNNTSVTLAANAVPASFTTNTLRFVSLGTTSGNSLSQTVTLSGVNVIQSGGVLVTTNSSTQDPNSGNLVAGTDNSTFTITGGSLTSGNGTDLIVNQFNALSGSSLTIASKIVNNGGTSIGLTLGGNTLSPGGLLILTNPANSYTGPTVINAATTLQAGAANVIPSTSAVVISMLGTLNLNGFSQSIGSLANNGGNLSTLAGLNFGYGATVVANGTATLTVGGDNTSTTFNGALKNGTGTLSLVKIGSGKLTLGNFNDNIVGTANLSDYSGGTTITAGTLDIVYDADLGPVPASPTTNVTFNGNVGTPTLQFNSAYAGISLSTNRSIVVNAGDVGYVDTNGNPLITYAGLVTVGAGGTFGKAGAGVFELDAPPSLGNSSIVSVTGGTLRLKYGSAATIGTSLTASVSSGATLELAGAVSQLSQAVNIGNNGTLLDSSSVNQNVGAVTGTGNTVVNSSGSLTAYQIRQNSLSIGGGATVMLLPSGSGSTTHPGNPNNINFSSSVTSLSIGGTTNAWTGTLDIGNNGLVVAYGSSSDPYATIDNMIKSGFNGGSWGGTGITSTLAQAAIHATNPLNIGLVDFTPGQHGDATFIVFSGQTIATNAVLVRLTYMDDIVLAGDMAQNNATSDALLFAANFGVGTTWGVGDLTHDGLIDSNDALLFAANYGVGFPSLDGTTGNAGAFGGNTSAVPEPASLALASLGALGLAVVAKRRKR